MNNIIYIIIMAIGDFNARLETSTHGWRSAQTIHGEAFIILPSLIIITQTRYYCLYGRRYAEPRLPRRSRNAQLQ